MTLFTTIYMYKKSNDNFITISWLNKGERTYDDVKPDISVNSSWKIEWSFVRSILYFNIFMEDPKRRRRETSTGIKGDFGRINMTSQSSCKNIKECINFTVFWVYVSIKNNWFFPFECFRTLINTEKISGTRILS